MKYAVIPPTGSEVDDGVIAATIQLQADADSICLVATSRLATSPGHPSYQRLNRLLAEDDFDEQTCVKCYADALSLHSLRQCIG